MLRIKSYTGSDIFEFDGSPTLEVFDSKKVNGLVGIKWNDYVANVQRELDPVGGDTDRRAVTLAVADVVGEMTKYEAENYLTSLWEAGASGFLGKLRSDV